MAEERIEYIGYGEEASQARSKARVAFCVFMVIVVMVIWGFSYVIIRLTVKDGIIPPFTLGFMRFVFASAVLHIIPVNKRIIRPGRRDGLNIMFMGFCGVFMYFTFENFGLVHTTATNASILIALAPAFTLIGAAILYRQKITMINMAGMIIAFIGGAFVIWNGKINLKLNPLGDALIICSAISWAAYTLSGRKMVKRYDSVIVSRRIVLTGMVLFAPFSVYEIFSRQMTHVTLWSLIGVVYLGVMCTAFAFVVWNRMMAELGIIFVTNLIYFQCVITMLCAWITIKEPITPPLIAASLVVVAGVYLSNLNNLPTKYSRERRTSGICH